MRTFITLLLLQGFIASCVSIKSIEEATKVIQEHVKSYSRESVETSVLCEVYNCCTISETETCALTSMTKDATSLVLPGGESRCIFSTSSPYAFQVIPGDSDKLLFYFQGGGACWSKETTAAGFCSTEAKPTGFEGLFDRSNADNKFKDFTIVQALYCSGDVWGGDVVRDYNDDAGVPVTQKGQANGQATLDWVKQQQDSGALSSTLSELVVMGCSAGSIGAQLWGTMILDTLQWDKAAIIPDSYAGVFPEGTQGPLVYDFGLCSWNGLPSSLYESCNNQQLTLQDLNMVYQNMYPNIPFGFVQSKADAVQQSFYIAIGVSMNTTAVITPEEFYSDVNEIFGTYNKANSNFITYLVNGPQHCFTPLDVVYTADGLGPLDNNSTDNTGIMMNDWLSVYPLSNGESVDTLCLGDIETGARDGDMDTQYCSSNVSPKEFTESYD